MNILNKPSLNPLNSDLNFLNKLWLLFFMALKKMNTINIKAIDNINSLLLNF